LLVQLYQGSDPHLGTALRMRIKGVLRGAGPEQPLRTAGDLRRRAHEIKMERTRREAEQRAEAARQRSATEAADTERRQARLRQRGAPAWRDAEALVEQRTAKGYGEAVVLLLDLRAIATDRADFARRISMIRSRHASKRSFISRLDENGLV
jgi:hypothetical protein